MTTTLKSPRYFEVQHAIPPTRSPTQQMRSMETCSHEPRLISFIVRMRTCLGAFFCCLFRYIGALLVMSKTHRENILSASSWGLNTHVNTQMDDNRLTQDAQCQLARYHKHICHPPGDVTQDGWNSQLLAVTGSGIVPECADCLAVQRMGLVEINPSEGA